MSTSEYSAGGAYRGRRRRPGAQAARPAGIYPPVTGENAEISVNGRHDACVALRAAPLIEAAAAIAIADEVIYENDRRIEK